MTKIEKINSATTMKSRMKGVQARSHNINCFSLIHRAERCVNQPCEKQGLRASSQQFTSPLEFNAIFRDGFPVRLDLNG